MPLMVVPLLEPVAVAAPPPEPVAVAAVEAVEDAVVVAAELAGRVELVDESTVLVESVVLDTSTELLEIVELVASVKLDTTTELLETTALLEITELVESVELVAVASALDAVAEVTPPPLGDTSVVAEEAAWPVREVFGVTGITYTVSLVVVSGTTAVAVIRVVATGALASLVRNTPPGNEADAGDADAAALLPVDAAPVAWALLLATAEPPATAPAVGR